MKPNQTYRPIVEELLGRRTVLEWLGKGAVLALSGRAIVACSSTDDFDTTGQGSTPTTGDTDSGDQGTDSAGGSCEFPFSPGSGSGAVFNNWGQRTVENAELLAELGTWRLIVDGLVRSPFELSFAQLVELPRQDQVTDFHCVEGWTIESVPWNGVNLSGLLNLAEPLPSATHLTVHSVGGVYIESIPLEVAREAQTLLAYGVGCNTIPQQHGFPARIVIPRKWGYKGAKFVYRLQLDDQPRQGYWENYGYPYDGDVSYKRLEALRCGR